jgi:hypothetical protein
VTLLLAADVAAIALVTCAMLALPTRRPTRPSSPSAAPTRG